MNEVIENVLVEFMLYNKWANDRLLAACEGLDEAQLDLDCAGAFGSIRDTLAHIIRGETWYLQLLTGSRPQPPFDWKERPSVAQMRAFAAEVGEMLVQTAQRVPPDAAIHEVDGEESFHYLAMPLYIQIVNHGVEHRTNITTVLNLEGLRPPGVDGWGYLNAHYERLGLEEDAGD